MFSGALQAAIPNHFHVVNLFITCLTLCNDSSLGKLFPVLNFYTCDGWIWNERQFFQEIKFVREGCYPVVKIGKGKGKSLPSVHMFGLLYVHQKREDFSHSLYLSSLQGSTPSITNFIIYPLCFVTAFCSDVTSQLFSMEKGGASD